MTMIKSRHGPSPLLFTLFPPFHLTVPLIDVIVTSSILVLKSLIQSQLYLPTPTHTQSPLAIISHLAHRINDIRHPHARACVLWLVGQYSPAPSTQLSRPCPDSVADWATDVLRRTAKSFCQEVRLSLEKVYTFSNETSQESIVKLQIITLAAKLLVLCPTDQILHLLNGYVFSLARYDRDYDVRDRGRMLKAFLAGLLPSLADDEAQEQGGVKLRREQIRLILFDGKVKTRETAEHTCMAFMSLF
jgi:AP-3 complex subunit beta